MNELCRNDLFRYQRCITQIWLVLLVGLNTVLRILLLVIASYCCWAATNTIIISNLYQNFSRTGWQHFI